MLFYHKLAAQSSALDLIWQSEKSCSQTIQIFTDASQEYLKGRAILNTMHLHLSARRWKQMWKLPIFLCTTICPLTVMCCSAFLYLLHLQQIGLENIVFLKKSRASRKGCLLMQAGCSLNFLSTAFCGAWGGTMWISSKNSSINRWFMTQFFSLMFCFPNFTKYKQREMSCSFLFHWVKSVENQLEAKPIYLFRCSQTVWVHFYCYPFHWICSEVGSLLQEGKVKIFESISVILYFSVFENLDASKFIKFKWCVPNTFTSEAHTSISRPLCN